MCGSEHNEPERNTLYRNLCTHTSGAHIVCVFVCVAASFRDINKASERKGFGGESVGRKIIANCSILKPRMTYKRRRNDSAGDGLVLYTNMDEEKDFHAHELMCLASNSLSLSVLASHGIFFVPKSCCGGSKGFHDALVSINHKAQ